MSKLPYSKNLIGPFCTFSLLITAGGTASAAPTAGDVQLGIRGTFLQSTTIKTSGPNAPPKATTTEFGLLGKGTLTAAYLLSDKVLLGLKLVDASRVEPSVEYWFAPGNVTPYAGLFIGYGSTSNKSAGANELRAGLELGVHSFVNTSLSLDANLFGAYGSGSSGPNGARLTSSGTSLGLLIGLSVWPSAHTEALPIKPLDNVETSSANASTPTPASRQQAKASPNSATVHITEQDGLSSLSASFPNAQYGSLRMILAFRPAEDAEAFTLLLSREAPLATTEASCGTSFVSAGDQTAQLSELTSRMETSFQSVQVTQRGKVAVAKLSLLSEAAPALTVCNDAWPVLGQARDQIKSFLARVNARVAKEAAEREAKAAEERARLPANARSPKKGAAKKSAP